jgi:hypothetical protein
MTKDFEPFIAANTAYWIPTIIKVENGFILQIQSPSREIKESYVYNDKKELYDHLESIWSPE